MSNTANNFSIAESKNYPFIDGLRGIVVLMVVAVHTGLNVGMFNNGTIHPYLADLIGSGALGVQLFFMVSVFTLFSSSFHRFKVDRFPEISFYIRRAFRILPFWWLMVFVFGYAMREKQILPSLLFYFIFIALIVLGLSYVSFNIIEKPCVKLGKQFIRYIENCIFFSKECVSFQEEVD